jgi:hypothetical protein
MSSGMAQAPPWTRRVGVLMLSAILSEIKARECRTLFATLIASGQDLLDGDRRSRTGIYSRFLKEPNYLGAALDGRFGGRFRL